MAALCRKISRRTGLQNDINEINNEIETTLSNNGDDNLVVLRGLRNSVNNTLLELKEVEEEIINLKERLVRN